MTSNISTTDPEESPTLWTSETDPDGYTVDDISPKDWYLETVLTFVHGLSDQHRGGFVGLTVISGGAVVSGLAISRAEWIASLAEQYEQAGAGDTATYLEKFFSEAHADVVTQAKRRMDAELPVRPRSFLHMKDARIGASDAYTQVPLWRGALTDISGWSLGSWNPKQNPDAE